MKQRTVFVADHFCGAGGTSTGVAQACEELGIHVDLLAVNHWQVAIDTHAQAHPWARHLCASLTHVKPREAVPGGRLHLLVASPECTNHSIAKGGRPKDEQSRATAWDVLKWLQELYVDNVLLENVREFRKWGPLGANGKPLKSKEGETYRAFLAVMRSMGYRVEDRVLNCADYGAPTSRERLFILARRGNRPIHWPEPTHSRTGSRELFGGRKRYRAAREVIDWSVPNPSIFTRKRPLKPNTMRRIIAGLERFNPQLAPFLVHLRGTSTTADVNQPLPTVTAGGRHFGLCEPMLVTTNHGEGCETRRTGSVADPLPTLTTRNGLGLCEAVLLGQQSGAAARSVSAPVPTVATAGAISLTEAFLVPNFGEREGQKPRTHSLDMPLPAATSHGAGGLVQPVIVPIDHTGSGERGARSAEDALSTITTEARHGLAEAYLTKYYGTAHAASVDEPLDAVTCKDRFGLVQPEWNGYRLDIRFRMLQPHELAAAMTFPKAYPFTGTKSDVTKQIGNAVPPLMGKVLALALLRDYAAKRAPAELIEMPEPELMEVRA